MAEIMMALTVNVEACDIVPVAMGSPVQLRGVANLLDDIVQYFPSPDKRKIAGINTKTNEIFEADYNFAKAKSMQVFKTIVDPFIGKYSMIKVCSGVIKNDDVLFNIDKEAEQRLNKLYVFEGSKPIEVPELHAGDIGAPGSLTRRVQEILSPQRRRRFAMEGLRCRHRIHISVIRQRKRAMKIRFPRLFPR